MNVQNLIYPISKGIINPRFFGLIREMMPTNYEIERYSECPERIIQITDLFLKSESSLDDAEILDCFCEDENIYSIRFEELNLDERTMLYFFFCVECDEDTDVVFSIESHAIQRLWLNEKMTCLCGQKQRQFHTLRLVKGRNIFCIQQHDSIPVIRTTIRFRSLIADQNDDISLTHNNLYYQEGMIGIRTPYLDEFCYNGKDYRFILYPRDYVNLDDDTQIHMEIVDHVTNTVLYERECRFHEFYSVSTKNLHYCSESIFNYLDVKFTYDTISGDRKEVKTQLYLSEPKDFILPIRRRAESILDNGCSAEAQYYLQYILNFNDTCTDIETFHKWERISKVVSVIESGEYHDYLRSEGEKVVCYHSDIDDTLDYYTVTLPHGYCSDKKYPLLIINNVLHGDWLSSFFSRTKRIEVIAVDFNGKGITMGSYVGDAAFNEIYNDVFAKFSIDENKVLMIGHSNGGYATWAQAQVTPDRYSAIFPAVSEPNPQMLMNLSNMSVRYFTSESDYLDSIVTGDIENAGNQMGDYKTYRIEKFNHSLMGTVQFNEKIIEELLRSTRDRFPNEVYFSTDKNRYLKAYWVKIHSIRSCKELANVHACIDENTISIEAENITGITVTVPPQVDKKLGNITINGNSFAIDGNDEVILVEKGERFIQSDTEQNGEIYIGTGLIDPFITPVRIISFLSESKEEILNRFRSPETNGFYGGIRVSYPVLDVSSLESFPAQSLVVLDNCSGRGEILDAIRKNAVIKTDLCGYTYQDEQYNGDYLIMQIVTHPTNPQNSILYINTNNEDLYSKCLFTRKPLLPAYANGYHEYLNSYALIFQNGRYMTLA